MVLVAGVRVARAMTSEFFPLPVAATQQRSPPFVAASSTRSWSTLVRRDSTGTPAPLAMATRRSWRSAGEGNTGAASGLIAAWFLGGRSLVGTAGNKGCVVSCSAGRLTPLR